MEKMKYKSSSSHILDEFALVLLVDFTTFLGIFEKITVSKYRQKSYSPHIPHEFVFTIFVTFQGFYADFFSDSVQI